MAKPHLEVAIALIAHDGRVLVARRHADVHAGGCWEFPGGKRHEGESYEACIVREVKEELGVDVVIAGPWVTIEHEYPEHTVTMQGFKCRIIRGEPRAICSQEIRWIPVAELNPKEFPPANQHSVAQLQHQYAATQH